jgi:uncharacterized protein with gpF-like domain
MSRKRDRVLRPVHPNSGIQALYRQRISRLVDEMSRSYEHWLRAQYRSRPPVMAQDASPAVELQREIAKLGIQWKKRFEYAAPRLARWFATAVERRSMRSLKAILKEGGLSVDFVMTKGMRDVFAATVSENVSLIKSIGSQYHTEVEGLVMRSASVGGDLSFLTKELKHRYGITERRAKLIARDQNSKATAVFTRVRQQEVGITQAVWLHSGGGNHPRPTHVANSGKRYNIAEGWHDPDPKVNRRI